MRSIRVLPVERDGLRDQYDLVLAAAGFETRSRYVSESGLLTGDSKWAFAFPDRQLLAFADNCASFRDQGFVVQEIADETMRQWVENAMSSVRISDGADVMSVAVDISSMSRTRTAAIVDAFRNIRGKVPLEVDFVYALAEFSPPPVVALPNAHVGPVLPSFAGWSHEPDQSPTVVLGLGYEQDRALGAVEHLQPGDVWVFVPESSVVEYSARVADANSILMESLPTDRMVIYHVERPFDCFSILESLVYGLKGHSFPVLLPLGPKIFSLLCLMVGCVHGPEVAVWRVSPGTAEVALDRVANGTISCIRGRFAPGT